MNLKQYREITSVRYDNATSGGTDVTIDSTKIDPNKFLVVPINSTSQAVLNFLLIILTTLLLVKQFRNL